MKDTRSDYQYRKALVKLLKDEEKKGGQQIPVSYISEIMSSKSIASVKREVKAKENKQKKYNNLKKSHKNRTYDELAKQYAKLQKKQGMSDNHIKSYINIFYKNKRSLLEKQVLLMENKLSKKSKKSKKNQK